MNRQNFHKILYAVIGALMTMPLSGCIRDNIPECPPLQVNIAVKDKNYFNVDKVELEDRLDESLPLRSYVPTLYWVLRDAATGRVVGESQLIHPGDELLHRAAISPDLPHGKYVLTVWGGLNDLSALGDDITNINFHPAGDQGSDIYLTNDTLLYDAWHSDYTVELERTKGKLIVEKLNLPSEICGSVKRITGLYSALTGEFKYSGETAVTHQRDFENAPQVVGKTLLSPTSAGGKSTLDMEFLQGSRAEAFSHTPRPVDITMRRNELTVVRYVWDKEKLDFDIFILINDNWEQVHGMHID